MLKSLLMLSVFWPLPLIGVLAIQNVPAQDANHGVTKQEPDSKKQERSHPHNGEDSATSNPLTANPPPAASICDEACQQGRLNLRVQRWLAYFTGGLVLVGFLQVVLIAWQGLLLRRTRADVHEQAGWMKTQTEHMGRQTDLIEKQLTEMKSGSVVAQRSADAAVVTANAATQTALAAQTSATAAMGVAVPTLVVERFGVGDTGAATSEAFFQFPSITITIKNYGQTPAFLKWWSLSFACEELPDVPVYDGPGRGIVLEKRLFSRENRTLFRSWRIFRDKNSLLKT